MRGRPLGGRALMKLKDKLLLYAAQTELARNGRFKNLHKGESCYIFGNGVSLKSMDLKKFNDKISIGSNSLFVHKDFDKLDCRYYLIPAAFFCYPYRKFYGKFQRNYIGDLYREKIKEYKRTCFFTSLSNCLNMRGENIYYTHHFGHRDWSLDKCEMDGVFSFMGGATYAMLGTAIYMGFESAVLVGCDYTFAPRQSSHFFEKGKGLVEKEINNDVYGLLFEELQKRIDLTTILQVGMQSNILKYLEYEEYVKSPSNYLENTEIVDRKSLDYLHKQGLYKIY